MEQKTRKIIAKDSTGQISSFTGDELRFDIIHGTTFWRVFYFEDETTYNLVAMFKDPIYIKYSYSDYKQPEKPKYKKPVIEFEQPEIDKFTADELEMVQDDIQEKFEKEEVVSQQTFDELKNQYGVQIKDLKKKQPDAPVTPLVMPISEELASDINDKLKEAEERQKSLLKND